MVLEETGGWLIKMCAVGQKLKKWEFGMAKTHLAFIDIGKAYGD
jgi:hypothetical protein